MIGDRSFDVDTEEFCFVRSSVGNKGLLYRQFKFQIREEFADIFLKGCGPPLPAPDPYESVVSVSNVLVTTVFRVGDHRGGVTSLLKEGCSP